MHVAVDQARCQGHNRCVVEAPEVFDLDDDLKSVVIQPDVVPALQASAEAAFRNCPERAIFLS
jgi:ferredoxin